MSTIDYHFSNVDGIELSPLKMRSNRLKYRKTLHTLSREGDLKKIEANFDQFANSINTLDDKSYSPLHYAAKHLHQDVVEVSNSNE